MRLIHRLVMGRGDHSISQRTQELKIRAWRDSNPQSSSITPLGCNNLISSERFSLRRPNRCSQIQAIVARRVRLWSRLTEKQEKLKKSCGFSRGFVGELGSDISVVESTSESTPQTDRQCAARPAASTESQSEVDDQNEKL